MDERDVRLQCLEMASRWNAVRQAAGHDPASADEIQAVAKCYLEFVNGTVAPVA